jgi:hypothetical protein
MPPVHVAHQQTVFVLAGDEALAAQRLGHAHGIDDAPGRIVGAADVAHLALPDEVVERPHRLVDRRQRIRPMHLIEVDVVGAEVAQAPLDGFHDVAAGAAALYAAAGRHRAGRSNARAAELGRDDDAGAPLAQRLGKVLLRHPALAEGIDIGRIEQGDTEIERRMHDAQGGGMVEPAAQVVASEADRRHAKS